MKNWKNNTKPSTAVKSIPHTLDREKEKMRRMQDKDEEMLHLNIWMGGRNKHDHGIQERLNFIKTPDIRIHRIYVVEIKLREKKSPNLEEEMDIYRLCSSGWPWVCSP